MTAPKVGLKLYDNAVDASGETVETIRAVLAFVGHTNGTLSPPVAIAQTRNGLSTVLLTGISKEEAEVIDRKFCLSTKIGTVITVPIDSKIPTYITTLAGFSTTNPSIIAHIVKTHIAADNTGDIIAHLAVKQRNLKHLTLAQARDRVLDTIEVVVWHKKNPKGINIPLANIHMHSPTSDIAQWRIVRDNIIKHKFTHNVHGTGISQTPHRCTGCRGVGHPRGLCPFPLIPRWNGPPTTTIHNDEENAGIPQHLLQAAAIPTQNQHNTGGRGGRDRGRGRGTARGQRGRGRW